MVARRYYDIGFHLGAAPVLVGGCESRLAETEGTDVCRGVGDAGSGVASCRFTENLALLKIGNLLQDDLLIRHVGNDKDVLYRHQRTEAVNCHLEQGSACAEEIQKLFGLLRTAVRPEPATDSTRHNYAKIVLYLSHFSNGLSLLYQFASKITK